MFTEGDRESTGPTEEDSDVGRRDERAAGPTDAATRVPQHRRYGGWGGGGGAGWKTPVSTDVNLAS